MFAFGLRLPDPFGAIATDSVPPPCAVDIERAVTEGKRARRKRAVGVTSGAAGALAAICVAALVAGGSGPARPEAADSATLPITGADPFIVGARFGWLPDGVDQDSSSLFRGGLWLAADSGSSVSGTSVSGGGGPEIGLSLRTFPSGFSEQAALAESATPATEARRVTASPQPPIDGRPAYAITETNSKSNTSTDTSKDTASASAPTAQGFQSVTLLWQLSNGRWAELVQNVAETVTPDAS
ncbi:MAG TPA: hypothetical protein VH372_16225, partial [Actinospica sp.]|nr:hypothetical protein [Actinospica sp.]